MSNIRVPHRGQLGQASTAGGVAVIVAIVTSHEIIGGSTTGLSGTGGRCSLSCSLPVMTNATRRLLRWRVECVTFQAIERLP